MTSWGHIGGDGCGGSAGGQPGDGCGEVGCLSALTLAVHDKAHLNKVRLTRYWTDLEWTIIN